MLGNVLLLAFLVFSIFGILGVQLWAGKLRNRCFISEILKNETYDIFFTHYSYHRAFVHSFLSMFIIGCFFKAKLRLLIAQTQSYLPLMTHKNYFFSFNMTPFYKPESSDFLCSLPKDNGMQVCSDIWNACLVNGGDFNTTCKDSTKYYTKCKQDGPNPFFNTMSFDNIAMAWVFIYQVIIQFQFLLEIIDSYWIRLISFF